MSLLLRIFIRINQSPPRFFTMPRKAITAPTSTRQPHTSRQKSIVASTSSVSELAPSPVIPSKRQLSITSETKRKARNSAPAALKRAASTTVLDAVVGSVRQASPDEGESQNPDLDDAGQAIQPRQPAVNSDILPLPWKGRLGFAYSLHLIPSFHCLMVAVSTQCYEN
jgi:hypothetical protein